MTSRFLWWCVFIGRQELSSCSHAYNKLGGSNPECWLADSRCISDCIPWVWQNIDFYCSNYVGNQFIITIRHLRGLWYIANIPQRRAGPRHSAMHRASEQTLAVVYWPHTTPPRALLLNFRTGGSNPECWLVKTAFQPVSISEVTTTKSMTLKCLFTLFHLCLTTPVPI